LPGFAVGFGVMSLLSLAARSYYLRQLFEGFRMYRHLWRAVLPSIPAAAIVLALRLIPGDRPAARAVGELVAYAVATIGFTMLIERRLLREMWSYLRKQGGREVPPPAEAPAT
jgi:hypothetical protein